MNNNNKALLVLSDGSVFEGKACGKIGETLGELCFNTGMTGYQEIFTDPSYAGQLLITSHVHIGNYGIAEDLNESDKVQISGLICRSFNDKQFRVMSDDEIQSYFEKNNCVGISDVDTRMLVHKIREEGAMNAIISSKEMDVDKLLAKVKSWPSMEGTELASKVTTKKAYALGDKESPIRIAVLDLGVKRNILKCLTNRGAHLKVFSSETDIYEIDEWNPNAYFLSNGPGDPACTSKAIETTTKMIDSGKPTFGICLGHQMIALASGLKTEKMHHGHRGINHPVQNLLTGKSEITSQNHGFTIAADSLVGKENEVQVTHINLNDESIEGIQLKGKPVFSVQYHPEASPGPHDSRYLFDQFIQLIKDNI